jgi:hypothetical protein
LNADGPTSFIESERAFTVTSTGNSPLNGSVQIAIIVDAGPDCALGTALITAGTSATVKVLDTRETFPVTGGRFCIAIS